MINKLKDRIFMVIMISLSIITVGVIFMFSSMSYNNILNTSTTMLDRMVGLEPKKNNKVEDFKTKPEVKIDGVYRVIVEDSKIVQSSDNTNNINDLALKISKKKRERGIAGDYIYNVRKINKNTEVVSIINDEETTLRITSMLAFSVVAMVAALAFSYFVSKNLSKIIVKPVEDNFEKQKQFISDASHELKTPLAVIEANTDVLKDLLEKDNKWINYIQNETDSMNKLINELLLLAKTENVDNVKEREKLDLSKEVEIILSMFESMAYEKKVTLNSNIEQGVILNCNKEDIEHITSTLLDNAIKHTKEGNEVLLELKEDKGNITLEVKNQGEEIPVSEREKIFERFYRIDKSRNRNEKRYGLGLAIAKSMVDKYDGKISVDCKDGYTIFTVTIPS